MISCLTVSFDLGQYPGGVLGPKIAGGVPWATENWTQKDRGENGILGPKRSNFVRICTQKIVFVLVDEKKHPKKIEFGTQRVKKGGQNRGTYVSPIIYGVPPTPPPPPRGQYLELTRSCLTRVLDCSISSALAMKILQPCTEPSRCWCAVNLSSFI